MHRLTVWLPFIGLISIGCSEAPGTATLMARDSAGVRIVEHAELPTLGHSIVVSASPVFRFGDDPGEHEFTRVGAAVLQPDGSAVVTDIGGDVLVIGPDGTLRGVLARAGEGPGEVRSVTSLHVLGQDTILLEDDRNARIMILANSAVLRSIDTRGDRSLSLGRLRVLGAADRSLLMATGSYDPRFEGTWLEGHLVRFDLDAESADTVATFDLAAGQPQGGPTNPVSHFGAVTASGPHFITARTDASQLIWRDPSGSITQIVRWPTLPSYPTSEHLAQLEERFRKDLPELNPGMPPETVDRIVEGQLANARLDPNTPLPFFMTIEGDGEGGVWVSDFAIGSYLDGIPSFTVIGARGEWLGRVALPPAFRALDVVDNRVLGVLRDELNVESVALFQLGSESAPE